MKTDFNSAGVRPAMGSHTGAMAATKGVVVGVPTERQHMADQLRGIALLGIVVVNVPFPR